MIDVVERVFERLSDDLPEVPFRVRLWDGTDRLYGTGDERFILTIRTPEALSQVATGGSLGFGEAYMSGGVEVEGDLQSLLRLAYHPAVTELHLSARDKARVLGHYVRRRNTKKRSRQNVAHHYDLGNDFYQLWLDEGMTYSCAYWGEGCESLEAAQAAKYEHICRKLHLKPGERLVDIGCGWGGMLAYAGSRFGVEGVGYTLSTEQATYANERLKREGLHPRTHVVLEDYREARGPFDKFVSIGMFEHVGKEYYDTFFRTTSELLTDGAIGVLHTIGKDLEADADPWITTHIFPGGYLPTLAQIAEPMGRHGLVITDVENLRLHYAWTLDHWAERFERHTDMVAARYGEEFVRMWRFYLNGCSASFKYGNTRVFQVTFTKGLRNDLPLTREHLYA